MNFVPKPAPWMAAASCTSTDPEAFFPEVGDSIQPAVKVCNRCPVRLLCLDARMRVEVGLSRSSRIGVWGGLGPKGRVEHEPQWLAEQAEEVLSNVA